MHICCLYNCSPWNENLNLLVQMHFLNLFLYISLSKKNYKNYWTWAGGPVLTVRTVMA